MIEFTEQYNRLLEAIHKSGRTDIKASLVNGRQVSVYGTVGKFTIDDNHNYTHTHYLGYPTTHSHEHSVNEGKVKALYEIQLALEEDKDMVLMCLYPGGDEDKSFPISGFII